MKRKPSGIDKGLEFVAEHTFQLKERMWMENLARNMPLILEGKDIRDFLKCKGSAIVIGAGLSVEKYDQLETVSKSGYGLKPVGASVKGTIIATDKMLKPCLRDGIVPDLVMTADGDPAVASFYDEIMNTLIQRNSFSNITFEKTKAVLNALTTHPDTVAKVPYDKFWYITPVDDPFSIRSITRAIHFMTKKTILSSFGNVGGQAFNLACFLEADPVILVGLDCGYPPETPLEETSYYKTYAELAKRQGKKVEDYFTTVRNPDTGKEVMLDMNWSVYREVFLKHMRLMKKKVRVINCSPISSLFGEGITHMSLKEVLQKWPR